MELNETSPIDFSLLSIYIFFLSVVNHLGLLFLIHTDIAKLAANDSEIFPHGNRKNAHCDVARAIEKFIDLTHASSLDFAVVVLL